MAPGVRFRGHKNLHNTVHKFIMFKHSAAQVVTVIVGGNYIR